MTLKRYSKRFCPVCEKMISCAGLAWVSHSRKHVREGYLEEIIDWNDKITFRKTGRKHGKRKRTREGNRKTRSPLLGGTKPKNTGHRIRQPAEKISPPKTRKFLIKKGSRTCVNQGTKSQT